MDEIKFRTMVVNRVNECIEEIWTSKAREKIQSIVNSILSELNFKSQIEKKIIKIIEETLSPDTRSEIVKIIKKHSRPQIIYVNEASPIPPQLEPFGVREHFMAASGPCIYFLCREERIVYIGQSICLSQRISQHVPYKNFDRVFYFNVPAEELTKVESELINYYDPELNRTCVKYSEKDLHERQRR
jgi:transcription initiation factor TFIIIB Brf1 subunit/transcription initiation factor TFIIB